MSFLFANPLDDLVDKATSENLPVGTDDIVLNLEIADKIKAKEVTAKQASQSLRRRLNHKNPNVQLLVLKLTDTCVKNSGHLFLQEVASREFTDNLVSIARAPTGTNPDVRSKILACLQSWGLAFKSKADLRYVTEVYEHLKRDGLTFPAIERSDSSAAMIETTTAPEWTDSDVCMRCRSQFTTFNRKHHCRNCGQTFCKDCSSKTIALSHLGIVQPVRVCDSCHTKLSSKSPAGTPKMPRAAATGHVSGDRDYGTREDADLQKALALSLEASRGSSSSRPVAQPVRREAAKPKTRDEDDDADLKAAIAASLQDLKVTDYTNDHSSSKPTYDYVSPRANVALSAASQNAYPTATASVSREAAVPAASSSSYNPHELSAVELENIRLFSQLVERTEADVAAHGLGALANSQIQTLYAQIATMQPKLSRTLDDTVRKYGDFYDLHEQLTGAVREYDRLLQERLSNAGYRKPHVAPGQPGSYPSGYPTPAPAPQTQFNGGYYQQQAPEYQAGPSPPGNQQSSYSIPPQQYYEGGPLPGGPAPQSQFPPQQQYYDPAQPAQGGPPSQQYHESAQPPQAQGQLPPQQYYDGGPAPVNSEHAAQNQDPSREPGHQQPYGSPPQQQQAPPGTHSQQQQQPGPQHAGPSPDQYYHQQGPGGPNAYGHVGSPPQGYSADHPPPGDAGQAYGYAPPSHQQSQQYAPPPHGLQEPQHQQQHQQHQQQPQFYGQQPHEIPVAASPPPAPEPEAPLIEL
ncbi:Vacuolar protein-sorting-associated protein 27 [Thoreauomyces humboldtii]|nr:Vacuolar protein-sorting-associated protein 27 [Thoreauomyces humboldtii]